MRDWIDGYGVAGPLVFIAVSSAADRRAVPRAAARAAPAGCCSAPRWGRRSRSSRRRSARRWRSRSAAGGRTTRSRELAGPRLLALRAWVGARGFQRVLLARIAPGMPYNLVNYAAGLTPVALGVFAPATAIGVAPRAFAYTALGGASATSARRRRSWRSACWSSRACSGSGCCARARIVE